MSEAKGRGPLEGVRVLELGRYIAGPFAGKLLADLGAGVIKIEDTDKGDPMRVWQGGDRAYSPQFAAYNGNKRGLALDLKSERGRRIFSQLVEQADILIENFRPGVTERLGIGAKVLAERNPGLIYCSVTGFGQDGPYVTRPAYDTIISAMSGLYGMILDPEAPRPAGPAFSDLLSGTFAALSVVAALFGRPHSGGQRVDVSMLGAVLGFLTEASTNVVDTGETTLRDTRQRRAQAFGLVGSDGLPFVVHLSVPEKFWLSVTDAMDLKYLRSDSRFATRADRYKNYDDLDAVLKSAARSRTRADWSESLTEAGVPYAPINAIDEVFADPQVESMNLIESVPTSDGSRAIKLVGRFAEFSRTPMHAVRPAPRHGEHTDEVLAEIGISAREVEVLRRTGVVV